MSKLQNLFSMQRNLKFLSALNLVCYWLPKRLEVWKLLTEICCRIGNFSDIKKVSNLEQLIVKFCGNEGYFEDLKKGFFKKVCAEIELIIFSLKFSMRIFF